MKRFTLVIFILQPEALSSKHLKIIRPYCLLGDKWSVYNTSRENPLSWSSVQSGDRKARDSGGEGRE